MAVPVTDVHRLHTQFYKSTKFIYESCGCVWRGDMVQIKRCGKRFLDKNGEPTIGHSPNITLGGKAKYNE